MTEQEKKRIAEFYGIGESQKETEGLIAPEERAESSEEVEYPPRVKPS